jgi:very-short-patch-repair endonuclease
MDAIAKNDSEVLIALLKKKSHFFNLQEKSWYHIPLERAPKRWPPEYVAFYQSGAFGDDAFRVRYFGHVKEIIETPYKNLFPNLLESSKSEEIYFQIFIEKLEQLPRPIPSRIPRYVLFIPTKWHKFIQAEQMNDLFDESPLEDTIWQVFKSAGISAERQWREPVGESFYQLDFAIFCNKGKVDVEADGDTWHARPDRIPRDNQRNNDLEKGGWHVLRFNGKEIRDEKSKYLLQVQETINRLEGLKDDGLVPRKFSKDENGTHQMNMFEEQKPYSTEKEFGMD